MGVSERGRWAELSFHAVVTGDEEAVRLLLQEDVDVNRSNGRQSLLTNAGAAGHLGVARLLIAAGATVGYIESVVLGDAPRVRMFLNEGADPNGREPGSARTPAIVWAAAKGHDDVVAVLAEYGADLDVIGREGRSPLTSAVLHGHTHVVRTLIARGARFSLFAAAALGDRESIELFLRQGTSVNIKDASGMTALMAASSCGHLEVVKYLLDCGADIFMTEVVEKDAVRLAIRNGHVEVVRLLLGSSPERREQVGRSEFCHAIGDARMFDALLELGFELDKEGLTLLHYNGCLKADPAVFHMILSRGLIPPNARTRYSLTPLMVAAFTWSAERIPLLIHAGADIHATDDQGHTALHWSAGRTWTWPIGCAAASAALLHYGADVNARDRKGDTPLMRAVLFQNDRVTETLIRHGADTAIRNGDGKTALDIAEEHGFAAMAAILRRASN